MKVESLSSHNSSPLHPPSSGAQAGSHPQMGRSLEDCLYTELEYSRPGFRSEELNIQSIAEVDISMPWQKATILSLTCCLSRHKPLVDCSQQLSSLSSFLPSL